MLPVLFLSDFGLADPYVGQVKGVLQRHAPGAVVIDLFHDLPAFAIESGAWLIERCRPHMPDSALWLCVVDPGVGSQRAVLLVQWGEGEQTSCALGPDNGLLTTFLKIPGAVVREILPEAFPGASATFHGRDLFAPAAGHLLRGEGVEGWSRPLERPPVLLTEPWWEETPQGWRCRVMLTDRYGNLVTGLPGEVASLAARGEIHGQPCGRLVHTFASVEKGEAALVVGGFGTVEVVVNQGSAAQRFLAGVGDFVTILQENEVDNPAGAY